MNVLMCHDSVGVVYINFDKIAYWNRGWNGGSVLVFDDADHTEITVSETPDELYHLTKGSNAPASPDSTPRRTLDSIFQAAYRRAAEASYSG